MVTWTHIAHEEPAMKVDAKHTGKTPAGYASSPHSTSFRMTTWTVSSEQHTTLRRPSRGR